MLLIVLNCCLQQLRIDLCVPQSCSSYDIISAVHHGISALISYFLILVM